jgi:hypothetical protein
MNDRLYDAFEVCRAALATGVPLEAALGLYPELAAELRPALEAWGAASMLAVPTGVSAARLQRSRTRLLGRAAQLRGKAPRPSAAWFGLPRLALAGLAVMLVLGLGWGGLATASAQALPGDPLYRVKRTNENVRLNLTGISKRSELETEYAERRSTEARNLLALGRAQTIEFTGVLRSQAGDVWDVDGLRVTVGSDTEMDADIRIGVTIKVEGTTDPGGNVLAGEIHLVAYPWEGTVEAIGSASWTITDRVVRVGPGTAIASDLRVGDRVLALIDVEDGQDSMARAILYLGPGVPTPTPATPPTDSPEHGDEWKFEGPVQAIGSTAWVVAGQTLLVTPETEIDGALQVGDTAKVKAQTTADGRLFAVEIRHAENGDTEDGADSDPSELGDSDSGNGNGHGGEDGEDSSGSGNNEEANDELSFSGQVTAISGDVWTIAGQQVVVNGDTDLEDDPGLNDVVNVEARMVDGHWVAEKIEKQ